MKDKIMYNVILAGKETSGEWRASVHSIFNNAVNLLVNDKRLSLLFNPLWISEHNIILSSPEIVSFIGPQSTVSSDSNYLYIDDIPRAKYNDIALWQMPKIGYHPDRPIPQFALNKLLTFLEGEKSNDMLRRIEQNFINAATDFCRHGKADFVRVIGAGPGLTPSGDDMLVGFALAVHYHSPSLLPQLSAACWPLLNNTTDISKYLLLDALNGQFAFPLLNLLIAITQSKDIDAAIAIAANIGSSSGRDGIFGFYQGLKLFSA